MQTSWSTGDSSRTITVTESGTYTVTVTNPGRFGHCLRDCRRADDRDGL